MQLKPRIFSLAAIQGRLLTRNAKTCVMKFFTFFRSFHKGVWKLFKNTFQFLKCILNSHLYLSKITLRYQLLKNFQITINLSYVAHLEVYIARIHTHTHTHIHRYTALNFHFSRSGETTHTLKIFKIEKRSKICGWRVREK